jgi:hypothetical protein
VCCCGAAQVPRRGCLRSVSGCLMVTTWWCLTSATRPRTASPRSQVSGWVWGAGGGAINCSVVGGLRGLSLSRCVPAEGSLHTLQLLNVKHGQPSATTRFCDQGVGICTMCMVWGGGCYSMQCGLGQGPELAMVLGGGRSCCPPVCGGSLLHQHAHSKQPTSRMIG